jgi:hypothetical protein
MNKGPLAEFATQLHADLLQEVRCDLDTSGSIGVFVFTVVARSMTKRLLRLLPVWCSLQASGIVVKMRLARRSV